LTRKHLPPHIAKGLCCFLLLITMLSDIPFALAQAADKNEEFNAVWISYLEFNDRLKDPATGKPGFTKKRFTTLINEMFDNAAGLGMNAVVVHVRPFGDAFYPSKNFPWSKFISGTQGVNPGFDPLEIMINAAHERGLEFHAWINPYRITSGSTDINSLAKTNMARKWLTDKGKSNDRRVLSFGGSLYYNPGDNWVQQLIRDGIEEIITNYDVDGIHFDDYFYPVLGTNYKNNFDSTEYQKYVKWCRENDVKIKTIENWRRDNVNKLVKKVYKLIKEHDESIVFGISPGGFLDVLTMDDRYYCDIKTWLSKPGYVDYICPQLYWSFSHSKYPYAATLDQWLKLRKEKSVKVYVGIAVYKAGSDLEAEWKKDPEILKKMIEYARDTGKVDGFMHFRYDFFYNKATQTGVKNLLKVL
jgi:uncharacterized lipoprotein YddW (UPF0748 family)